jgi:signal transduction histidine kinase
LPEERRSMEPSDPPDESSAGQRLRIGSAQERATAASILGKRGAPSDIALLQQARARELDHYALAAIDRALAVARQPGKQESTGSSHLDWADETYAKALSDVSQMLVHELQDIVGFARLDIAAEVSDPDASKAMASVKRIGDLLDAIELLGVLGRSIGRDEFDLSDCLMGVAAREEGRLGVEVSLTGPTSLVISGSPSLVDLVVTKAIQNAVDSADTVEPGPHTVVISWGATDREAWIAVIDAGAGLIPGVDAFGFGKSSKKGHLGVGLTIARRAMTVLSGTVTLEPNSGRGATFRATWPL